MIRTSPISVRAAASMLILGLCSACSTVGPNYERPQLELPANWKALPAADESRWHIAAPADAAPRHDWWVVYGDPVLNDLMDRCVARNYSLQAALTRLDLAQAQIAIRGAAGTPQVQAGATAQRSRISADRPLANYAVPNQSTVQNDFKPSLSVSYEFDWLGRIRRDVEGARASAEQTQADIENLRLLLTAQLASSYFTLRQADQEQEVVQANLVLQRKVLDLQVKRHQLGSATQVDLEQQQALITSTQAQLDLLKAQRAQQENAIATLTGTPAAEFTLSASDRVTAVPALPAGLPSTLLERRPDVASAERAMAAANAQIGVNQAARYPNLMLAPNVGGFESNTLSHLISTPALIWSLGIGSSMTLFDGGRIDASVNQAKAAYAGTVASYRQTVLAAVEETQTALSNLQQMAQAVRDQDESVRHQDRAFQIGLLRYREGLDNTLQLAVSEQNLLTAQRSQTQLHGTQLQYSVTLIKALGGGWAGLHQP
ncbi:MAG: efflux transporter outer membrane subunit [Burkholderiaceae bacterium]|nr:efflux transporter outer membrane subunit [Burkholderiaceae bacterium]